MTLGTQIIMTIFMAAFSALTLFFSFELIKTKSTRAKLDKYESDPKSRTFLTRVMYGWMLGWQRNIHRSMTNSRVGDKLFTAFLRVAGIFFLIFTVALWAYLVFLWVWL